MRSRLLSASFALVAVLVGGTSSAQTEGAASAQSPAEGQEAPEAAGESAEQEGTSPVSEIPPGIELTEGTGFRYSSRGRRDPFVSLALGFNLLDPQARPPGLQGMLIQEVTLRGIVKTLDGHIAMIQGTDNKSYFARAGERLYDGHIQRIDDQKVVFRQEINDPLRIEKFQEVEKTLYPVEGQR